MSKLLEKFHRILARNRIVTFIQSARLTTLLCALDPDQLAKIRPFSGLTAAFPNCYTAGFPMGIALATRGLGWLGILVDVCAVALLLAMFFVALAPFWGLAVIFWCWQRESRQPHHRSRSGRSPSANSVFALSPKKTSPQSRG
jgi:hypothetical protein